MKKLLLLALILQIMPATYAMHDTYKWIRSDVRSGFHDKLTRELTLQFIKENPTASKLEKLSERKRKELIMQLVEENPAHIHTACDIIYRNTPLHESVLNFDFSYTQWLLEHGADINYKNDYGDTPLYALVEQLSIDTENHDKPLVKIEYYKKLIRFLIFKGADPDLRNHDRLSARQEAILEIQAFITTVEQDKLIKENLQAPDRKKIINDYFYRNQGISAHHNPGHIIASYLNEKSVKKSKHHRAASA